MDGLIDYFTNISSAHRSLFIVGGLTFFFIIENAVPLFKSHYNKWKHTGLNIFFTLTTILVNFLMAFILLWSADWVVGHNVGVVQWLDANIWVTLIVGLLVLDLIGAYFAHWIQHQIQWMWQFHVIHHTDLNVDTTTANRHHPGESVIRFAFTVLAVFISGAPIWLVFLYQSSSVILSQFNHANISMPRWLDEGLNIIFCTPNMHRVHHHYRQPYTDTNYGNIFSFWDRLFGTYVRVDNEKLIYGVDTYKDREETDDAIALLKMPFVGYRQRPEYDQEEVL